MNSDSSVLHGSLWKGIFAFSVPVAATSILEQLFNASDVAIVGSFSSADRTVGVAAVGANSALIGLIVNLFIGIALGATVVIANAIGAGDKKTVHQAVHTSILMALAGGFGISLVPALLMMLGGLQNPDPVGAEGFRAAPLFPAAASELPGLPGVYRPAAFRRPLLLPPGPEKPLWCRYATERSLMGNMKVIFLLQGGFRVPYGAAGPFRHLKRSGV